MEEVADKGPTVWAGEVGVSQDTDECVTGWDTIGRG